MPLRLEDFILRRQPGRVAQGVSAVLLPYGSDSRIDESGLRRHLRRTLQAGLQVAVNMDTGYIDLLTPEEKQRVLSWTGEMVSAGEWFFAGALPAESSGAAALAYGRECETIAKFGGVPVIFPSARTASMDDAVLERFFRVIASGVERFLAFELGPMFNPYGRMFSERVLKSLMELPQCIGVKHSSLDRTTELARLDLRDSIRPGFVIYTGNDLASDMIEYGSDYLLGLSTFAPELFAARDRAWAESAADYLELRDFIQYLGWIGFREPVPGYKHSAAIFLNLTGRLDCDEPHPRALRREDWDRKLLADAARRLQAMACRVPVGKFVNLPP